MGECRLFPQNRRSPACPLPAPEQTCHTDALRSPFESNCDIPRRERSADAMLCEVLRTYPEASGPDAPLLMLAMALDAIPRAQGRSLVGATQRVEGLSRNSGSVLGPAMVGAENLFVDTERGFGEAQ
jgi:hypothetical protein